MRHLKYLCLIALCTLGNTAVAQVTVPHTFTSGTPARADEVNANFQALVNAINALGERVDKLEGPLTAADIAGTYHMENLQIGVDAPSGDTEVIAYRGPFTLAANGTFTTTFTGRAHSDAGPTNDDGAITGTWTFANGVVTASVPGDLDVNLYPVAGGQLLVAVLEGGEPGYGHGNVFLLLRTP